MYHYVKIVYECWAKDQDQNTILEKEEVFLERASKCLYYTKEELRSFLHAQPWYPKQSTNK